MSIVIGAEWGYSVKGSDGTNIRRRGWTGRSMPANFATCAAHGPAAFTTLRVETVPRLVSTPATPVPFAWIAVTSQFFQTVAPCCVAYAVNPVIARYGSTKPSVEQNEPPTM